MPGAGAAIACRAAESGQAGLLVDGKPNSLEVLFGTMIQTKGRNATATRNPDRKSTREWIGKVEAARDPELMDWSQCVA